MRAKRRAAGSSPAARLAAEVVRAARRTGAARALFLDLDGTLAPIVRIPESAAVPASALHAIRDLTAAGWRITIVSGRPLRHARKMAPVEGIAVFGSHGLESGRGGPVLRTEETSAAIRKLKALAGPAARLVAGFEGAMLETKPAGVAFHDRRIPPRLLSAWRRGLREFLRARDLSGVELLRGKRVLELRPAGIGKGSVVRALMPQGAGGRPDASLVAMGDDTTDEEMFEALAGRGLGVRVGRPKQTTLASRRLASPAAVAEFLERIAGATAGSEHLNSR